VARREGKIWTLTTAFAQRKDMEIAKWEIAGNVGNQGFLRRFDLGSTTGISWRRAARCSIWMPSAGAENELLLVRGEHSN
jgi:hypothetical protein